MMSAKLRTYLKVYNFILAVAWLVFLFYEVLIGFHIDSLAIILLSIAQWAAVLEVGHAAMDWVRSPVFSTLIQVLSRVFVVVLLYFLPAQYFLTISGVSGWHLIVGAWSITEIIRYFYYFQLLRESEWHPITWFRYSLFSILYPVGVIGEILIVVSVMNWIGWQLSAGTVFLGIVLVLYLVFFPQLYGYMWKQRSKKLTS
jgi:very-long-chain (3R)-3-hydroxyacyl-CoA dehydratase